MSEELREQVRRHVVVLPPHVSSQRVPSDHNERDHSAHEHSVVPERNLKTLSRSDPRLPSGRCEEDEFDDAIPQMSSHKGTGCSTVIQRVMQSKPCASSEDPRSHSASDGIIATNSFAEPSSPQFSQLPEGHVSVANMKYTQLKSLPDGSPLIPTSHGTNRDASRAKVFSPSFAVSCVADGVALRYWSQVVAEAAVSLFIDIFEAALHARVASRAHGRRPSLSLFGSPKKEPARFDALMVGEVEDIVLESIIQTNNAMLAYELPDTGEVVDLAEKGGQCTFVACVVVRVEPPSLSQLQRMKRWLPFTKKVAEDEFCEWVCMYASLGDSEGYVLRSPFSAHGLCELCIPKTASMDEISSCLSTSSPLPTRSPNNLHACSSSPSSLVTSSSTMYGSAPSASLCGASEGFGDRWVRATEDAGRMLPEVGLQRHHIPPLTILPLNDGDVAFCWSDGVPSSFVDRCPPPIPREFFDRRSVYSITNYLVGATFHSQLENDLAPDDVAITAIMVKKESSSTPSHEYPHEEPPIDPTVTLDA